MVTLYSTGCPKCNVLKKKLDAAGITYSLVEEESAVLNVANKIGATTVPILEDNDKYMDFAAAIKWINDKVGDGNA